MTLWNNPDAAIRHRNDSRDAARSQGVRRRDMEVSPSSSGDDPVPVARWDAPVVGHHHRSRYALGGIATAAGMSGDHVVALAGWLAAPFDDACAWLVEAHDLSGERYALRVVRLAIERRQDRCEAIGRRIIAARKDPASRSRARDGSDGVKFALGTQFYAYGLRYTHAAALAGLFTLGTPAMIERLGHVAGRRRTPGGRLVGALRTDFAELDRRGHMSAFNRGAAAYAVRCDRFAARELESDDRSWRDAPVTRPQRWTILDTARELGLEVPACSTCGEAADWLRDHGAILKYRKAGR